MNGLATQGEATWPLFLLSWCKVFSRPRTRIVIEPQGGSDGHPDNDPFAIKFSKYLYNNFISRGKLGVKSGEGFYKYPNPEYKQEGFIPKF